MTYESVVFFELENFVGVPSEVSGNLQRNDGRWHIATGLDEVDGLSQGMFGNAGPYFGVTFKF